MTLESILESLPTFSTHYARLIEWGCAEANCARWKLSQERFAEALRHSASKQFRGRHADKSEVEDYLKSLHLEDLALACACSESGEEAWEYFIANFRQDLRSAARAILRSAGNANEVRSEELADSLFAELYGISASGGKRKSLFDYFHGRSKLSTWLRAVLAQRHVDFLRSGKKTVSLDAESDDVPRELAQRTNSPQVDPHRELYLALLDDALSAALADLPPRERLLLAYYYGDQLTLAEIGRTLGDHESTISRQLDRTRRILRELVAEKLRRGTPASDGRAPVAGLSEAQVELTFEYALEDWPFDLSRALSKGVVETSQPDK